MGKPHPRGLKTKEATGPGAPDLRADQRQIAQWLEAWDRRTGPQVGVGVPPEMLLEPMAHRWASWKMVPSPVTPAEVAALEVRLGCTLPQPYVAFLTCHALHHLDFGSYRLPPIPPREGLQHVSRVLQFPFGKEAGYLTFGAARGAGDPLCFDLSRMADGDCPVVVFNHDFVPRDLPRDRAHLEPYAAEVAEGFRPFLEGLLSGAAWARADPPLSPAELARFPPQGSGHRD